jgi:hypothetical protein
MCDVIGLMMLAEGEPKLRRRRNEAPCGGPVARFGDWVGPFQHRIDSLLVLIWKCFDQESICYDFLRPQRQARQEHFRACRTLRRGGLAFQQYPQKGVLRFPVRASICSWRYRQYGFAASA